MFLEIFGTMWHGFLPFLSGLLDRIMPILVWFERSPHPAQGSRQSCPWPLKLVTSQAVEGTWIRRGGYGRLRGKGVKVLSCVNWTSLTRAFHQHITNISALYTQHTQEKLTQTYMHFPYHQSSWTWMYNIYMIVCHATLPCKLELVQYWKDSLLVRESKTVLDSGFHAMDSSLCQWWNLDSGC